MLATEPLTIMVGSGTVNPMTVYDVQVWQAGGKSANGSAVGAVYCPGNDGSKGPPTTTTPVTPAPTGKHGRNRAPGSVATAQVSPEQAAAGANDNPAAPMPVFVTRLRPAG
jgi:hypothetical protein